MKIYNNPNGSNPTRVRIYLAEKGLDIPLQEVDFMTYEHKTPFFLEKNGLGRLPILELDDGSHLTESIAICRYLDELHPEPPLFGATTLERAQVEMWNRRIELEIYVYFSGIMRNTAKFFKDSVYQVPQYADACRKTLATHFKWLDHEIGDKTYLMGDTFTIADVTGMATFKMLKQTKIEIAPELINLHRWVDTILSRPSVNA